MIILSVLFITFLVHFYLERGSRWKRVSDKLDTQLQRSRYTSPAINLSHEIYKLKVNLAENVTEKHVANCQKNIERFSQELSALESEKRSLSSKYSRSIDAHNKKVEADRLEEERLQRYRRSSSSDYSSSYGSSSSSYGSSSSSSDWSGGGGGFSGGGSSDSW